MRTTVTLSDAQAEYVDALRAQDDALDSNAAAVRRCVEEARKAEERIDELEREVESLRADRDDLRRQLQEHTSREREIGELVEYVEEEKSLKEREQQRRQADVLTRAKWWLLGEPEE
jgi:uncharacterized coiled-coil DUF342 family protein